MSDYPSSFSFTVVFAEKIEALFTLTNLPKDNILKVSFLEIFPRVQVLLISLLGVIVLSLVGLPSLVWSCHPLYWPSSWLFFRRQSNGVHFITLLHQSQLLLTLITRDSLWERLVFLREWHELLESMKKSQGIQSKDSNITIFPEQGDSKISQHTIAIVSLLHPRIEVEFLQTLKH